jgi:hypothetical protein
MCTFAVPGRHFGLANGNGLVRNLLKTRGATFGSSRAGLDTGGGSVVFFEVPSDFPGKEGRRVMVKFAASSFLAGALLALGASAQSPPDLQRSAKTQAQDQAPPAPVIAPLGVGTAFNASLDDTLDTRKTRTGDPVTAETAEDVCYERSVIFPKGTKVIGHIVRVTSGGRGRAGSAIFIQFDKALLKDGQEVILNAGIQALAVGAVAPMPSDADAPKSVNGPPQALPVEDNAAGATATDALVVSTIYEAPRAPLRAPHAAPLVAEGEFTSDGLFTLESKGAFGRPDVKVYTPTSEGSHGTVLLSTRKNMHLDGGTRLLLVVQPPPSGDSDAPNSLDLAPNQ